MEAKISIQDLTLGLAQRVGVHAAEADTFVRAFFDLIAEKVVEEKVVKVKGLGTFKLLEMSERESVDVNTGERILIPGHSKVSFTPDVSLRDQVNKPFVDFQTVILNEGTSIEEMERFEEQPVAESPADVDEEEPNPSVEVSGPDESDGNTTSPAYEIPASLADGISTSEPEPEAATVSEPMSGAGAVPEMLPVNIIHKGVSPWFALVYFLLTLFLMSLSYYVGYHHLLVLDTPITAKPANVSRQSTPGEPAAAVKPKVLSPADSLVEARRQAMKVAQQYPQVPGGKYLIVGTRRVHTMKVGDSLLKLALKEYGHKDFAQYIIIYNQFQNPDVIHVGQEVKLPDLIENGPAEVEGGSMEFQYPR